MVWSIQGEERLDALYNAGKEKDQAKASAVDPLIVEGGKLIPSVTRVFSRSRPMYVFLQGYEPGAATPKPIVGFVTIFQEGAQKMQAQPIAVTPAATAKLAAVPLSFHVDLAALTPGDFDCQVTVADPSTGKSNFWRAPIKVVP